MSQTLKIKDLQLGLGPPKIIVPLTGPTRQELLAQAQGCERPYIDMLEWRADFWLSAEHGGNALPLLRDLRPALAEKPLIFTCRSTAEGGRATLPTKEYMELNLAVAASGLAEVVDVEIFALGSEAFGHIEAIHKAGALALASWHDIEATPPAAEMVERLQKMAASGADIIKIAVMPHSEADVLKLLQATLRLREQGLNCPWIAIAMGQLGLVSRVAGGLFGSAATFGAVGIPSAPGQVAAEHLAQMRELLYPTRIFALDK